MKKFCFLLVIFCFSVSVAFADQDNEIISTDQKKGIESSDQEELFGGKITSSPVFEKGIRLSAPCEKNYNMATAIYVFEAKEQAQSYTLKVSRYQLSGYAYLMIRYSPSKAQETGNQGESLVLNPKCQEDSFEFNSKDYVREGAVEIHFSATNGGVLDIDGLELTAYGRPTKVKKVVHEYISLPQEERTVYHYYYRGPIYRHIYYYGEPAYVVYDNWWTEPSFVVWFDGFAVYANDYPIRVYRCYYYSSYIPTYIVRYKPLYYRADCKPRIRYRMDDGGQGVRDRHDFAPERKASEQSRFVVAMSTKTKAKNPDIAPVVLPNYKQGPINLDSGATKPIRDKTGVPVVGNINPAPKGIISKDIRQVGYKVPAVDQKNNPGSGKSGIRQKSKGFFIELTRGGNGDSQPKGTRDISNVKQKSQSFLGRAFQAVTNTVFDTGNGGSGGSSQPQAYLAPSSNGGSGSTSPVVEMKKRPDPPPPVVQQNSDDKDKDKSSSGNSGNSSGGKRRR